jgi:hypothetical protein
VKKAEILEKLDVQDISESDIKLIQEHELTIEQLNNKIKDLISKS